MSDVVFKASLDDSEVNKALQRIDKNIDKLANRGARSFDKMQDSASKSGVKIGAVSGVVQELTRQFIQLGAQAVKAFVAIATESVKLNSELELARISVTQIFGGNQKAADAFLETIKDSARLLGISRTQLTQLAKGVLPDIGSIRQTKEFVESIIVLGRDAGVSFQSIRIAAEEALSGNLSSLQRRLNIPKVAIDRIKELQEEFGETEGIVRGLAERVEKTGISIEATTDSLTVLAGQLKGSFEDVQVSLGAPIAEELKEQIIVLSEAFEENRDNIEAVATVLGDLTAQVIDFIGTNLAEFIDELDFRLVEEFIISVQNAASALQLILEVLFDDPDVNAGLLGLTGDVLLLAQAMQTLAQVIAVVKSSLNAIGPSIDAAQGAVFLLTGNTELAIKNFKDFADGARQGGIDTQGFKDDILNANDALERHIQRIEDIRKAQAERRKETEDTTEADLAAGEALLQHQKALDNLARAESEAADAQEKITERQEKFARDVQKRLTKIQLEGERNRLDDLIKNAQKREDIARRNAQKIEDIFRENQQDITDAATDLSREEQDIARRAARDRGEVERDLANERVDIERDFRQELLRIQQQFNQSAEEAERNNDAQAFLQAVRTRDDQIDQAKLRREGSIDEAKIEGERRRDELKKNLAFEIEDAKITNRRKLEDLQISLQRELDAQQINLDRQLEAQAIAEARQAQERQLALQRQLDDFARANRLKREDLQRSLEAEFAAVRAFETAKADFAIAETRRAVETIRRLRAQLFGGRSSGGGSSTPIGLPTAFPLQTMQEGGPVNPNQPFLVGEAGPELFVPAQAGNIIPNSTLFSPPVQSAAIQQLSQSNTTNSPTFNLAESMFNDPVARQNLRNFILETMGGI